MEKKLIAIFKDNNIKYKLYTDEKVYKVNEDGSEEECTEFFKKNVKNIYGEEPSDVI